MLLLQVGLKRGFVLGMKSGKGKSLRVYLFFSVLSCIVASMIAVGYLALSEGEQFVDSVQNKRAYDYAEISRTSYLNNLNELVSFAQSLARSTQFLSDISQNPSSAEKILNQTMAGSDIDFAMVVNHEGMVLLNPSRRSFGQRLSFDGFVPDALNSRIALASTEIVEPEELIAYSPELLYDTRIRKVPSFNQRQEISEIYSSKGMMQLAAVPIPQGLVIVGTLLNRNTRFVDELKILHSADVSLYQEDIRIATTAMTKRSNRFIGVLMQEPLYQKVVGNSERVLTIEWFIDDIRRVAYVPIKNHRGQTIGALSVALSQESFASLFDKAAVRKLIGITLLMAIALSALAAFYFYQLVNRPIRSIIEHAQELRAGNFEHGLAARSFREMNELMDEFNIMIRYLRKYMVKKEREIISDLKDLHKENIIQNLERVTRLKKLGRLKEMLISDKEENKK